MWKTFSLKYQKYYPRNSNRKQITVRVLLMCFHHENWQIKIKKKKDQQRARKNFFQAQPSPHSQSKLSSTKVRQLCLSATGNLQQPPRLIQSHIITVKSNVKLKSENYDLFSPIKFSLLYTVPTAAYFQSFNSTYSPMTITDHYGHDHFL